nr:RNA-directed DNA polymerase, eukaryota, nucleotide-binding alpha-beta plait domain protein [Tanacetum cinerariifolium]
MSTEYILWFTLALCNTTLTAMMCHRLGGTTTIGDQRSKEDDVRMISTSICVTNFPDYTNVKELWRLCSQYGNVIDSFIPNRRSKNGKRFGFVRFIKSANADRLVDNLCTIWIGRFKLYVNVARFNRPPMNKGNQSQANIHVNSSSDVPVFKRKHPSVINGGDQRPLNSYIQAFKIRHMSHNDEGLSQPSLVLDELIIDERVAWIDVEGVPLKVWSRNTFVKISSKWGSLLYEEDEDAPYFHRKRLYSQDDSSESDNDFVDDNSKDRYSEKASKAEEIPETVFEAEEPGEIKGSVTKESKDEEMEEAHSKDPFNIYDLLEKNNN